MLALAEFNDECLIGAVRAATATGDNAAAGGVTLLSGTVTATDLIGGGDRVAAVAVSRQQRRTYRRY